MAVSAEVQTLQRRGTTLSPLGVMVLSVILAAAVVMGVLVGRWTAPSTTRSQAEVTAPGWATEANSAGYTGRLGFSAPLPVTGSDEWAAESGEAGFTGRLGFITPIQGPASGWEGAARDAGYTGHLGTNAG